MGRQASLMLLTAALVAAATTVSDSACPDYSKYSQEYHAPFSGGQFNLSYQRPEPRCRTFNSSVVEDTIARVSNGIRDPDLARLFINSYPNTLDTAIKWRGYAAGSTDEELTFVITGDINAMWLRDSANQMQSYLPLLQASSSPDSLASLYRGVINLQSRYILLDPYCNSFQPPIESGIAPSVNGAAHDDMVRPVYSNQSIFECKYELDSLAAFLEISHNYYNATNDVEFFQKYSWVQAIETIMQVASDMMVPTYAPNGTVNRLAYSFSRETDVASETTENHGLGNPFNSGTGLIRSFFRPSDDATIFMGFIPANMMFSRYLASAATIMTKVGGHDALAQQMSELAAGLRSAIEQHGVVQTSSYGAIYAYEVDGYMSQNIMDDANIPSLLAAPVYGYLDVNDEVYQNTRKLLLSTANPYWMHGPVISAIGGPHDGPGFAWPMASIVRILTSTDDAEITQQLQELVSSTDGLGLIHESINTFNVSDWTRQWFSWANGLFGQTIVELSSTNPSILEQSFQPGASTIISSAPSTVTPTPSQWPWPSNGQGGQGWSSSAWPQGGQGGSGSWPGSGHW